MFERLAQIETRWKELNEALASPEIVNDSANYQKTAKAQGELVPVVEKYQEYKKARDGIRDSRAMLEAETDPEMRAYAEEELNSLEQQLTTIEAELKVLLLPKDPNDEKNVILEIRAGTGGDEATLFAAEIFRMYMRYAESRRWKVEVLSSSESSVGGLKEVIAIIEGQRVYSQLKYESGVTTYSAVRLTHLPTNTVVSCQDEKSQIKNREKGMRVLRARLYEMEQAKQQEALAKERRSMVGSGDRSEKIRTYNFPQNRVSDHRIGLTVHQLDQVMEGKLQPFVDALVTHYQAEKLKGAGESVNA